MRWQDHRFRSNTIAAYTLAQQQFDVFLERFPPIPGDGWTPSMIKFAGLSSSRGVGASVVRAARGGMRLKSTREVPLGRKPWSEGTPDEIAALQDLLKAADRKADDERPQDSELGFMPVVCVETVVNVTDSAPGRLFPPNTRGSVHAVTLKPLRLFAVGGLLRRGEYLSPSPKRFNYLQHLSFSRLSIEHAQVVLRAKQTKQADKMVAIIIPDMVGSKWSVKNALRDMMKHLQPGDDPARAVFNDSLGRPLTANRAIAALRSLWSQFCPGVDPSRVSLHGARKLGAVCLAWAGVPIETIRLRGRWSTDSGAVFVYLKRMQAAGATNPLQVLAELKPDGSDGDDYSLEKLSNVVDAALHFALPGAGKAAGASGSGDAVGFSAGSDDELE